MSVACAPFEDADLAAQRALFELSFPENAGETPSTERHYRWKFRGFPAAPPSYEYVARDGNVRMLGYYAALPYRYRLGSQELTAGMVCDVMTHPDARGRGVFTTLGRYATDDLGERGIDFVTGYPVRPEVLPGHLKVGWRVVTEMPMYLRPVGSRTLLPGPLTFLAPLADTCLRLANRLRDARGRSPYAIAVETVDDLVGRADYREFLLQSAPEDRATLQRDAEFMRWRLSAPGTVYRIVVATSDGRLTAFAVTRAVTLKGVPTLAVLDMLATPGEEAALVAVHRELVAMARAARADAVVAMATRRCARRLRFGLRFLPTSAVFKLIVKRLRPSVPQPIEEARTWDPMWIDSDDL